MGLFYTGKGDKGKSTIGARKILVKDSVISEALGGLDELNSLLGLIKNQNMPDDFVGIIEEVQENLFIVQANVASALFQNTDSSGFTSQTQIGADGRIQINADREEHKNIIPEFSIEKVKYLEDVIDKLEREVNPKRSFVIPGATHTSGWLDYARAVSRRVERGVVTFSKKYELKPEILAYMNRLSSLLFAMARVDVKRSENEEKHPRYK